MAGNISRINLREAAEALWQYVEDSANLQQDLVDEVADRNRGVLDSYASRQRGLGSRLLGRLREAGMDAPEVVIGAGALVIVGTGLSVLLASRKRS